MNRIPKRFIWMGALAIIIMILLTIISGFGGNPLQRGSSYNRSPDGYGAWYAFMVDRGVNIKHWKRPFKDLITKDQQSNISTLIQVNGKLSSFPDIYLRKEWIKKGNTLVILGVQSSVTEAKFRKYLPSKSGNILIDTTRRFKNKNMFSQLDIKNPESEILGDEFGSVVISFNIGEGKLIIGNTPYIAANAYQDYRENYQFLAELVTRNSNQVLMDEYIHGYKDKDVLTQEGKGDWVAYLEKTPLFVLLLNIVMFLLVLIWAQNRRFGTSLMIKSSSVDNTEAYIHALSAVLRKAESSDFVVEVVGKAEQLRIQQYLGLGGKNLLDIETVVNAWEIQTQGTKDELRKLLNIAESKQRIKENQLLNWLLKIQTIWKQIEK